MIDSDRLRLQVHLYVRRLLYAPNVPGCTIGTGMHFYVPNGLKDAVGTGNTFLVYQQVQDVSFVPVEGNYCRTMDDIRSSVCLISVLSREIHLRTKSNGLSIGRGEAVLTR